MQFFDRHPGTFRLLFGALALYLVALAAVVVLRFGSAPTDENWFRDSPSTLYITRPIVSTTGGLPGHAGDLLVAAGGRKVATLAQLRAVLSERQPGETVQLALRRPSTNSTLALLLLPRDLAPDMVREIGPSVEVLAVIENGASDRAGMRQGDLILKINGKEFETAQQADEILRSGTIGKAIEYSVLRGNRVITLHVILAAFGFPLAQLVFTLCGLFYMGTGIFLGLARPRFPAARLLGLFFLLCGFFISVALLGRGTLPTGLKILQGFTTVLSVLYAVAVLAHADQYFPIARPEMLARRWIRWTAHALPVAIVAAMLLFDDSLWLPGLGVLVLFAVVTKIAFRKGASREYRRMNAVVRWTSTLAGPLTGLLLVLLSRSDALITQYAGYAGLILVAIPLAYLYTIGRYRLLDIDLRVRKNVQYSFASLLWTLAGLLALVWLLFTLPRLDLGLPNIRLTGASIELVDQPMTAGERQLAEKGVLMVLAVAATALVWNVGRLGRRVLARYFHRQEYDYRRAASELAEVMATRLNMNDLARGVVEKLTSLMRLKRAGVLFFRDRQGCCCQEAQGFDGREWAAFCVAHEEELTESLAAFKGEFRVEYLPPLLRKSFEERQLALVVPIRSKDRLLGAILVGEKLSESPFQQEDMEFLSSAARQASVAIENAFLHEELTEQERMRHELDIARRIQFASLPQSTPSVPGLEIAGKSVPAMEVGGDYFDYLNGDPRTFTVIVGDVSGKGTSAALYMSKVQGILRSLYGFGLSPRELFVRTNHLLCQDMEKKSFITAMGAFFAPSRRRLVLARAGHLPLYHYRKSTGAIDRLVPRGLGLGLNAEGKFAAELEERAVEYDAGDVFLLVTDGVTEAQRLNGEQFGEERMEQVLRSHAGSGAGELRDRLLESVAAFAGEAPQHDDQTVVVVKAV